MSVRPSTVNVGSFSARVNVMRSSLSTSNGTSRRFTISC